jgi:ribosomal protein L30E
MPLILLKVFNKTFQDIPDEYLNPLKEFNENEFENIMDSLRIFRQNLMVKIGITKTTYKELYPFAIGYKEDLEKVIELKIMLRLKANGSSSSHDSIHKYNIKAIPVQNYKSETLDLSTLINKNYNFLWSNVPKASSFDSVIIHYNSNKKVELELIQYKSSENISRGMAPNDQSKGVLVLGSKNDDKTKKTIWSEFNKVNDSEHLKFYSQFPNHSKTLFIISNKPLKNFYEIQNIVKKNDYKNENSLPPGVCLIFYENFNLMLVLLQIIFIFPNQKIKMKIFFN